MRLNFAELVEELKGRSASELVDLAEIVKHFAVEQKRAEIRRAADEAYALSREGRLDSATENVEELLRRLNED